MTGRELEDRLCDRAGRITRGLDSPRRREMPVHPEPQAMPVAGPELGAAVDEMLRRRGIAFHPSHEPGWVPVDRRTLSTPHEGVYAIGDATAIPIPGRWKQDVPLMLPKAGVFAHDQARVVARRIAAAITGSRAEEEFCGGGRCSSRSSGEQGPTASGSRSEEPDGG